MASFEVLMLIYFCQRKNRLDNENNYFHKTSASLELLKIFKTIIENEVPNYIRYFNVRKKIRKGSEFVIMWENEIF